MSEIENKDQSSPVNEPRVAENAQELQESVLEFDKLEDDAIHVNNSYTADDIQVLEGL